jgi:iron complex transport system substrate-binding protein
MRVTRRGSAVAALAATLLLIVGAGSDLAGGVGRRGVEAGEVHDMTGRRVQAPAAPRRVVSLAPSLTEIAYAVGGGDALVGVTQHCDYPPAAAEKPKIGGIYTPSFEAILRLRPDLILATTEGNRAEHIRALADLGLPVYVVRPVDFATVLDSIGRVGRLLGREAETRRLVAAMGREADTIAQALEGVRRPRVLYVVWGSPLIVPGRDTLITDLIRRAGGESVTGDEPLPYPRFSAEEALARRPERVVLARQGEESVEARLRDWPHLALLPAVRQGRVHAVEGDLLYRPGPRVVEGLRRLARLLHPEVAW